MRRTLSVVIVAYRSLQDLEGALPALREELGVHDELIVVDNGADADLAAALPELAPAARLISAPGNLGFAAGANLGAAAAAGEILVLLNPDAIVRPGFADAIAAGTRGPFGAWMGLITMEGGGLINTSGGVLHFTGLGWAGQAGEAADRSPTVARDVGFLSGACLAVPRRTWDELGGFPEDFFMYCEDVDLSLRLRLRGYRIGILPDAVADHAYDFAKGHTKWRLLERNRWATILRTYPAGLIALLMPALLITELAIWVAALAGGWWQMKALATADLVRALPGLLAERRRIQRTRRIGAVEFAAGLTAELSSPYLGGPARSPAVSAALGLYWRVVLALLAATARTASRVAPSRRP